jgi:hypothetical protein
MSQNWWQKFISRFRSRSPARRVRRCPPAMPRLEVLEDRTLLSTSIPLNSLSWTPIGPAPIGTSDKFASTGRITAVVADPVDPDTIYAAAAGGGVWKTAGKTPTGETLWKPLTDTQSTLFMGTLAVAHSGSGTPAIIYAGTGESNNSVLGEVFDSPIGYGRGVLKSVDGGQTWSLLPGNLGKNEFDRRTISKVVVDPSNPDVVYVAVGDLADNGLAGNTGIWKSIDGGASWTNTTARSTPSIPSDVEFTDLVMDPSDPDTLYAAVGDTVFFQIQIHGNPVNGVYKTANGGATWTLLDGPGSFNGVQDGRITLAISPSSPGTLYASIVNPLTSGLFKMLKTTDGGASWIDLTDPDPKSPQRTYLGHQGFYDTTLAVDPSDPDIVYAGGVRIITSRDGGHSWTAIDLNSNGTMFLGPHVDHHALDFDQAGKLLDGNDGGLWRLDVPAGPDSQWTDLNRGLQITQFYGIALDPANPDVAYGGSQDNGTAGFNDSLVWEDLGDGDGGFVRLDPSHPGTYYHYDLSHRQLYRSDNGPEGLLPDEVFKDGGHAIHPYVNEPLLPTGLLYGATNIWETTDRGGNWTQLTTTGHNGWNPNGQPVDSLAIAPSDPNTIYAAADGHVFVSTDHGATWAETDPVPSPSPLLVFPDLLVDPLDPKTAYVVAAEFSDVTGGGHVWRTADGGMSWHDISGDLPDLPAWSLALLKRSGVSCDGTPAADVLYVGTDQGVFASDNLGASWFRYGAGLPNAQARDLELSPDLHILAVGTYGRGVWEITQGVTAALTGKTLTIQGDANGNQITVRVKPGDPSRIEVLQDGDPVGDFDRTAFDRIEVAGGSGDDALAIDSGSGNPLPSGGVSFDGGAGDNLLVLCGGPFAEETLTPSRQDAGSVGLDGAEVTYNQVATLNDLARVTGSLVVNAPAGTEFINAVDGPTVSGSATTQVNSGAAGTFATINFANKANVTVNGLGGAGTFTLNNPRPADGLTSLTLNGSSAVGNTFFVQATAVATTLNTGGGGNATVTLHDADNSLAGIAAPLTVNGQGGTNNTLNAGNNNDFTLTDTTLASGAARVTLDGHFQVANLTGGPGPNAFDVSGWTGTGALDGQGAGDGVRAAADGNFVLTNTTLDRTGSGRLGLKNIEEATLTDTGSNHTFTVSGWTGGGALLGDAGNTDTVLAAKDADFTLDDDALRTSDGMSLALNRGIRTADLTEAGGSHTFTVDGWSGGGTLTGTGGHDTVAKSADVNFVLTNATLGTTDRMALDLAGIAAADLTGGPGPNTFDVSGWTGDRTGTLNGVGGNDTVRASRAADFTLADGVLATSDHTVLMLNSSIRTADLTEAGGGHTFTVDGWSGAGTLTGTGGHDTVAKSADVNFVLTNNSLDTTDGMDLDLAGIGTADLTGGAGANVFDVGGWTGTGSVDGGTDGTDTVRATKDADGFVLRDDDLRTSDGMDLHLVGPHVRVAQLTGGDRRNVFDVGGWSGTGTLDGQGGPDRVVSSADADFVLADSRLAVSGGASLGLEGIEDAGLTGGAGPNRFDVGGWTGTGTLDGRGGSDLVVATRNANFALTDSSLSLANGAPLGLVSVERASLTGGPNPNWFTVTDWGGLADLDGAGGGDAFVVTFSGRPGTTRVSGSGAGGDTLTVNGVPAGNVLGVTPTQVTRGGESVRYAGIRTLSVNGGAGPDAIDVSVTPATAYDLVVNAGAGPDRLDIRDVAGGGVVHKHPAAADAGLVEVCYLGGASSFLRYSGTEAFGQSPDADHSFAQALLHQVLGRSGGAAEVDRLVALFLRRGGGRKAVAQLLERSLPARARRVQLWFARYVDRPATAEEERRYARRLRNHTEEAVLARLLASGAYFNRRGGDNRSFLEALSRDLLGAEPSLRAISLLLQSLRSGVGREGVALQLLTSGAYHSREIVSDYLTLLRRPVPPRPEEVARRGPNRLDLRSARIKLESTLEFFDRGC